MSVHFGVSGLRSLIEGVLLNAIEYPAPLPCRLNRFFARISNANVEGDVIFDINVNGVSIFGDPVDRPRILAGETRTITFPDIPLAEGDMVTVDVDATPFGGVSGLYIIVQMQDAPTIEQYINDAYTGALNRPPDGTELSDAVTLLSAACGAGTTIVGVEGFFTDLFESVEYLALATTDTEYIEDLYNAVLGRPADSGGLAYWVAQIGALTRANILTIFSGSTEHINGRLSGWCPNTLPRTNAIQIQGIPISGVTPEVDQVITFDGTEIVWVDAPPASLSDTGVAADTYGDATHVSQFTVDVKGRITDAVDVAIAIPFYLIVAISDEATAITTGTAKLTFRMPYAIHCTEIRASLNTASSSGLPQFNVKKNGSTVFSTNLTIDASEKSSEGAATPAVLVSSPVDFADDDEVTIDIVTAGTGAKGAKIAFLGTYQ